MKDRLLSLLGICRKAGRLVFGFDAAVEALGQKTVFLIVTAADLSSKSKKEIEYIAAKTAAEVIAAPVTIEEIGWKTGKRAGILAVSDEGLAKSVKALITGPAEKPNTRKQPRDRGGLIV